MRARRNKNAQWRQNFGGRRSLARRQEALVQTRSALHFARAGTITIRMGSPRGPSELVSICKDFN